MGYGLKCHPITCKVYEIKESFIFNYLLIFVINICYIVLKNQQICLCIYKLVLIQIKH